MAGSKVCGGCGGPKSYAARQCRACHRALSVAGKPPRPTATTDEALITWNMELVAWLIERTDDARTISDLLRTARGLREERREATQAPETRSVLDDVFAAVVAIREGRDAAPLRR